MEKNVCLRAYAGSYIVSDMDTVWSMYLVFQVRRFIVIEVSTFQFNLHPINVPGIAFAQLEKIRFSG